MAAIVEEADQPSIGLSQFFRAGGEYVAATSAVGCGTVMVRNSRIGHVGPPTPPPKPPQPPHHTRPWPGEARDDQRSAHRHWDPPGIGAAIA